MLITDTILPVR